MPNGCLVHGPRALGRRRLQGCPILAYFTLSRLLQFFKSAFLCQSPVLSSLTFSFLHFRINRFIIAFKKNFLLPLRHCYFFPVPLNPFRHFLFLRSSPAAFWPSAGACCGWSRQFLFLLSVLQCFGSSPNPGKDISIFCLRPSPGSRPKLFWKSSGAVPRIYRKCH